MSFAYSPLTQTYGYKLTVTSDGAGGIILTCDKLGTLAVSAAQLANQETADLVARICRQQDPETNWANLQSHLGGVG